MTYSGRVKDGQIVFDGPPPPDGAVVRLEVVDPLPDAAADEIPFLERYKAIIGKAEGLPPDAASQVDHYLYGHPKK